MSILDRSHVEQFGEFGAQEVRSLEPAAEVELRVFARSAAVRAAAALIGTSPRFARHAPLKLAEGIEQWILRDEPDDPAGHNPRPPGRVVGVRKPTTRGAAHGP